MKKTPQKTAEHMFSLELKSKDYVKSMAFPNDLEGYVLIEGFLGKLEKLTVTEGVMLEINASNGSLKMDFTQQELEGLLHKATTKETELDLVEVKQ